MNLEHISRYVSLYFVKLFPVILTVYLAIGMTGEAFGFIDYTAYTSHTTIICHCYLFHIGMLALSYTFRFCSWHRVLIYMDIFVLILVDLYEVNIKLPHTFFCLSAILLLSLSLSIFLYFYYGCYTKKNNHTTL